jgi:hypothetical protein
MRSRIFLGAAMVVASFGVAATGLFGTAVAGAAPSGSAYTCTGGNWTGDPSTSTFIPIPSGNYSSLTVAGVCITSPGTAINVTGNINVAPGGVFNAQSFSSTITVGHNVTAAAGSLLGLGCLPNQPGHMNGHPCLDDPASSIITVNGNVSATDAFLVLLNGITVNKNVTLTGGGGGGSGGADWAEKDDTIGGNLTISGVTPDWLGLEFSTIAGNANLSNITAIDPGDGGFGAVNVVVNTIGHNLNCSGLGPRLSGGFIPGEVNTVGHKTTGQCVGLVGGE